MGAKSAGFFASVGGNVTATVRDLGEEPALEDLIGGVKTMLDAYTEGRIDALLPGRQRIRQHHDSVTSG